MTANLSDPSNPPSNNEPSAAFPKIRDSVQGSELTTAESSQPHDSPALVSEISQLQRQKKLLEREIEMLQARKQQLIATQTAEIQRSLEQLVNASLKDGEEQRQSLQSEVDQLERRKERVEAEMRTTFAGASQELAIRVQGFKDYLVGSLQDLAIAAEQLEFPDAPQQRPDSPEVSLGANASSEPTVIQQRFEAQSQRIYQLLDQYRTSPDYYGPPWQLRRTFEPIHVERLENWFFSQGGRGAIRSMGSRLQNILLASAAISILQALYGKRTRALVLANSPEQLGEWRRGLQDCLGISRSDFGPERGVILFEATEALVQKADRLVEENQLPLVIIDETEEAINLSLLQFPYWLAFAPDPQQMTSYWY